MNVQQSTKKRKYSLVETDCENNDVMKTKKAKPSNSKLALLICGDRNWRDEEKIRNVLIAYQESFDITVVIHGDCKGSDQLAGTVAKELNISVKTFPIQQKDWKRQGKSAGPKRNKRMVDYLLGLKNKNTTIQVVAFHSRILSSKGTKNCLSYAKLKGVPTKLVT